jgi:hypothetical protein
MFGSSYVTCHNYSYGYYDYSYYQANGILSFAVIDLAFKIIKNMKQQKRKSIILKKRRSIIHLLNYIDTLNFNFNSNKFEITFFLENKYKTQLIRNLYLYRCLYRREYYEDYGLKVIESENLCIIRLEHDYARKIHPKNLNLATMLMHILEKEQIDMIVGDGIIFYCVFLM